MSCPIINLYIALCVIIVFVYIYKLYMNANIHATEGYNDQVGQFCRDCSGKTFNQCLSCFNCGWCVDKYGNSGCIGGDQNGPYNYESCAKWYHGDPWYAMNEKKNREISKCNNANPKCDVSQCDVS
jgi:hypothetical protein